MNLGWLQRPKVVDIALGVSASWWGQEDKEEDIHQSQEDQAEKEEGEISCVAILQGMILGKCRRWGRS